MRHRLDQVAKALAEGTSRRETARRLLGLLLPPAPPPLDFDALARDVACGLSRRQALLRLGSGLLGAFLVALGLPPPAHATDGCPPGQEFCTNPDRCCPPHWQCCSPHCIPPDYTCCPSPTGGPVQVCPPGQACVHGSCVSSCPANTSPCSGAKGNTCCNVFHQRCCQGQCCDDVQATCCNDGCHPPNFHCCPEGGACPSNQDCCHGSCCPQGQRCVNGTCSGGCPAGQTLCGTSCVDTRTDPAHCGTCTTVCTGNTICSGGQCICPPAQFCADQRPGMTGGLCCAPSEQCHHNQGAPLCLAAGCPTGTVACQGRCVAACSGGKVLDATSCQCVCPSGLTDCSGVCVNTQTDTQHCGSCTNVCASGACSAGRCGCNSSAPCPAGQACVNGGCEPCSLGNETSCVCSASSPCPSAPNVGALACTSVGICGPCVAFGSSRCAPGQICQGGRCQVCMPPQDVGCECSASTPCPADATGGRLLCGSDGHCARCGGAIQCPGGQTCGSDGRCRS